MADETNDFNMTPVSSSQIAEVGYNADTKQLRVRFIHKNSLYEYDGVPPEIFDNLVAAPSVGTEFGQTVKGVFAYRRLE